MYIERTIIDQLKLWKNRLDRKPLLLFGARQIGKTWILKHFGDTEFEHTAYFSFDEDVSLGDIFRTTKAPHRIIEQLAFLTDVPIKPATTLIVFDEIQECPEALASLKYFCEKAPEYAVAAAGSLLGLTIGHKDFSFPVGKVDHLDMYPLSFSEFLRAKDSNLYNYYNSIVAIEPLPQIFFDRLSEAFNAYRICGGMPEVASSMISGNTQDVDLKLANILKDYSLDFVKHATPTLANKIGHVWQSLPSQLAKENRKFIYQLIRPGARAREYEDALIWLSNAGLTYQVHLCREPRLPLKAYDNLSIFKIYAMDIGLLRRLADMPGSLYLTPSEQFKEFKGALAENYILQSLVMQFGKEMRYWSSGNTAELEFLLQWDNEVLPVEVKSGTTVTGKSLTQYTKLYNPHLRIRFSMQNLRRDDSLINIPLFLADKTSEFIHLV